MTRKVYTWATLIYEGNIKKHAAICWASFRILPNKIIVNVRNQKKGKQSERQMAALCGHFCTVLLTTNFCTLSSKRRFQWSCLSSEVVETWYPFGHLKHILWRKEVSEWNVNRYAFQAFDYTWRLSKALALFSPWLALQAHSGLLIANRDSKCRISYPTVLLKCAGAFRSRRRNNRVGFWVWGRVQRLLWLPFDTFCTLIFSIAMCWREHSIQRIEAHALLLASI